MTCQVCNSDSVEPGRLAVSTTGGDFVAFRPDNKARFNFLPFVKVRAFMCADCGALSFAGDVEELKKRIS